MNTMHSPPHPGEFIQETYLEPFDISQNEMSKKLGVAKSTLNRLVRGDSGVSPEMAYRLSRVVGRSPESWLNMQALYDLYEAKGDVNLSGLKKIKFDKLQLPREQ